MANTKNECPVMGCGNDVVTKTLYKVGVNRGMMITLALLPFAWNGVVWAADAVRSVWDTVSTSVGS